MIILHTNLYDHYGTAVLSLIATEPSSAATAWITYKKGEVDLSLMAG